jgi:polyisoprenoid-binding protein YceI
VSRVSSPRFARLLGLLLAVAAPCVARAGTAASDEFIRLDSTRSHADFRVKVLWLLGVSGRFGKVEGTVHVDAFRSQLRVDARIDVHAVSMGKRSYEDWVKSPEFFDAARYPQIEFTSAPFPRARLRTGGELSGELTVRGVRQPVSFELLPSECNEPAYLCPIRVEGAIRRSSFDMGSHSGSLSDRVELDFSVYALAPPASGSSKTPG